MQRILTVMLAVCLCLSAPTLTFAQDDTSEAEDRYGSLTTRAAEAYDAGEYEVAVRLFEEAYALRPVSNILYNIGRIQEDAGNIDEAIAYYDRFVVAPNVEQAARKDAVDRLQTLRKVQAVRSANAAAAEPVDPEPVVVEPAQVVVEPEPDSRRPIGWGLVALGGGALVGSGIFALLAQSQFQRFENATTLEDRRNASSAGRANSVVADSLLIGAAVSATAGGVLLYLTSREPESSAEPGATKWNVAPLLDDKTVGMGLELNF